LRQQAARFSFRALLFGESNICVKTCALLALFSQSER